MSLLSPTVPHATRYQFTDPSPAYWVPIIFKWVPQIGEARVNPKKKKNNTQSHPSPSSYTTPNMPSPSNPNNHVYIAFFF